MKNLFIVKDVSENMEFSDEAFTVWCGLRNIMKKDETEYFVSFNMIAHSLFGRRPNRYELDAVKKGYNELIDKGFIKIVDVYSKSEQVVDLSALYFKKESGFFVDLTDEEMHKIMNINGNHSKYKLLRYFTAQIGSFNRRSDMGDNKGKIGGMSLDYFEKLMDISKPTIISFNKLLEDNQILFIIRHRDFFQGFTYNGNSEIREIPNTYSRWCDREIAKRFDENTHGYKYHNELKGKKTEESNRRRSLGKKLDFFVNGGVDYDIETIQQLYDYAKEKNRMMKKTYESNIKRGGQNYDTPNYIDMSVFDDYLVG